MVLNRRGFFGTIAALLIAPFVVGRKNKISGLVYISDDLIQCGLISFRALATPDGGFLINKDSVKEILVGTEGMEDGNN